MPDDGFSNPELSNFRREVVEPAESQRLVPELRATRNPEVWVYRYTYPETGWVLSIGTHGAPGSGKLSLGGFRIAPAARVESAGYDNDREAIGLAMGMEEKVHWWRVIRDGGPLGRERVSELLGGKCVLLPTPEARVGQPRDFELLGFALRCFHDFERVSGVRLNTGQDLGHGVMSDGTTKSLDYLGERFHGCVFSDTSKPTATGNYHVLRGMLDACGIAMCDARVGLIGCGNIGETILRRLVEDGTKVVALEASPAKRESLVAELGVDVRPADAKAELLGMELDAVVVNANGGSLDIATCEAIARNASIRVVCGSENLAMPDPRGSEVLREGRTVYAPTEFGGMMGYLTAVEEYYARHAGEPYQLQTMLDAARYLEEPGRRVTAYVLERDFEVGFEEAVEVIY